MLLAASGTVGITSGHNTLADILFLVAFILAVIAFVLLIVAKPPDVVRLLLVAWAACVALAWFVL